MTQHFEKPMSLSFVMMDVEKDKTIKKGTQDRYPLELETSLIDHSYLPSSPMSSSSSSSSSFSSNGFSFTSKQKVAMSSSSSSSSLTYIEQYKNIISNTNNTEDDDDDDSTTITINQHNENHTGELTLLERRQRNKNASAKYRQKKSRQQMEMKKLIDTLTENEKLLKRQVMDLRLENQQLKSMNDHLRGKIMAKKMLNRYIEKYNRDCHQYHPKFIHSSSFSPSTSSLSSPPPSANGNNKSKNNHSVLIDKMSPSDFEKNNSTTNILQNGFDTYFDHEENDSLDSF